MFLQKIRGSRHALLCSLCALLLVASAVLPITGSTRAYGEEGASAAVQDTTQDTQQGVLATEEGVVDGEPGETTPAVDATKDTAVQEGAQDVVTTPKVAEATSGQSGVAAIAWMDAYTVTFAGHADTQKVKTGEKLTKPTDLADQQVLLNGKMRAAKFAGWMVGNMLESRVTEGYFAVTERELVEMNSNSNNIRSGKIPVDFTQSIEKVWNGRNADQLDGSIGVYMYPIFSCSDTTYEVKITQYVPGSAAAQAGSIYVIEGDSASSVTYRSVFKPLYDSYTPGKTYNSYPDTSRFEGVFVDWCDRDGAAFTLDTPVMKNLDINPRFKGVYSAPVRGKTGIVAKLVMDGTTLSDASLSASDVSSGAVFDALVAVAAGQGSFLNAFEVNVSFGGKAIHDNFGSLTLSFPVDAAYNGQGIIVAHRHNNGTITSERVIAQDGMATITVTDLSSFALAVEESGSTPVSLETGPGTATLAQTGDTLSSFGIVGLAVLAVAACGCLVASTVRKRAGKQN